jgi:pimeloyl-ACP methyl ester carboxylesterase
MHVVLIHGQGRTPLSLIWLGQRLRRQKHQVHYFGYAAFAQSFDRIVERFVQTIRTKTKGEPYAIVGHSLGGIITRAALPHLADHLPQHLVMLAPPNRPAAVAKRMCGFRPYRWLTGDCGKKLGSKEFYQTLPRPRVPTTVIAGTRGWPKWISPFGGHRNDLVLRVDETELAGSNHILVHATHPLIMNSQQVAQITLEILNCGRISHSV